MPTPSSHQLPNQTSPPSYTFSTCPDDLPHPSRSGREAYDATRPLAPEMEVRPGSSTSITSPTTILSDTSSDGPATDDRPMVASHPMTDESSSRATTSSPRPQSSATSVTSPAPSRLDGDDSVKNQDLEIDHHMGRESVSQTRRLPIETPTSPNREVDSLDMQEDEFCSPYMGPDCSSLRVIPISPSSYLRAGSRFCGTQQSERQVYEVQVEIKHVDMRESFLCGYLRIQGLTEDHPTLTTYFEGEIIGSKYSFFTQHDDWGANAKVDLSHWSKFSAFRPFQKYARKGTVNIHDVAQRDHIFMRWKEHFLVPDHRVRTITGASFEGFYYICFNQLKGEVSGIYFHSKSEKFQQLELKHVPDRGCISATEFR